MAWRWSSTETPHPAVAHQTAKFRWHCHQSKGVVFQEFQALFAIAISPVSGGSGTGRRCLGKRPESLVISHNLLAGQRRLLLFEMHPPPRPICCRAFERVGPLVHALGHYVRHTHRYSKWGTGLSYICSQHCVSGAGGRSL